MAFALHYRSFQKSTMPLLWTCHILRYVPKTCSELSNKSILYHPDPRICGLEMTDSESISYQTLLLLSLGSSAKRPKGILPSKVVIIRGAFGAAISILMSSIWLYFICIYASESLKSWYDNLLTFLIWGIQLVKVYLGWYFIINFWDAGVRTERNTLAIRKPWSIINQVPWESG